MNTSPCPDDACDIVNDNGADVSLRDRATSGGVDDFDRFVGRITVPEIK